MVEYLWGEMRMIRHRHGSGQGVGPLLSTPLPLFPPRSVAVSILVSSQNDCHHPRATGSFQTPLLAVDC